MFSFLVNKIEGYTQEEIARKLQLTPSSVEKYMKRAMRHLQEKLQNYAPH
ncbi:RNA polymerase sigma factor [Paracandidimonas soli]